MAITESVRRLAWRGFQVVAVILIGPAVAQARSTTITVTPGASKPEFGRPTPSPPQPYAETFRYDPGTGNVSVSEQGRADGTFNEEPVTGWMGFGRIELGACQSGKLVTAAVDLGTDDAPIFVGQTGDPGVDATGIPIFQLTAEVADGDLASTGVIAGTPETLTLTWTDEKLAGLDLNCVQVDSDVFYFDGYGPPELRARAARKAEVAAMTAAADRHHAGGFDSRSYRLTHVKVTTNDWAAGDVTARHPSVQGNETIVFHRIAGRWRVVAYGSDFSGSRAVPHTVRAALGI